MPQADFIVPHMLADSNLPNILLGVIIVLLLSASVSTLCSVTLSAGSALSIDLVKSKIRPKMSDKKSGMLTKIFCILFIILSYFVATTKTPILDMMSYSWGIISGSFLAPYVLALYCKKLTKSGAWSGILTGFCIAIVPAACKLLELCGVTGALVLKLLSQGPLFACIAMVASIVVCLLVSALTQRKAQKEVSDFFYNGVVESE